MADTSQPIRIAISGGGLAGASLFHALLQYPHLDVRIYEAAAAFREAGGAVGIARNALSALDLISSDAAAALKRAGAVPQNSARFLMGQGPDAGKLLLELPEKEGRLTSIVHRASFLKELLSDAPSERMHAAKKLSKIEPLEDGQGPILLHFQDGSVAECDILIGADGIHSFVRKFVLGEDDPAAMPVPAGWWGIMALLPTEKMQRYLGRELVDVTDARQYGWTGDGGFMLHNALSNGEQMMFVASVRCDERENPNSWEKKVDAEELQEIFKNWQPDLRNALKEVLREKNELIANYQWEHLDARTFVSGGVAITGDAAHSMTRWQGSGAGVSLEDSLILSTLLGSVKSPVEARTALQVFDEVRRPRTLQTIHSSKGTGLLFCGRDPDAGLDVTRLTDKLEHRWDFILDFDVLSHRRQSLRLLETKLGKL